MEKYLMALDLQTILYIIAAIIYFIYSFNKAKKKGQAKKDNRKYNSGDSNQKNIPSPSDYQDSPTPKTQNEKPFSFESVLEEWEKQASGKKVITADPYDMDPEISSKTMTTTSFHSQKPKVVKTQRKVRSIEYEPRSKSKVQTANIYSKSYDKKLISQKRAPEHYKKIKKMLHNTDSVRTAFILSEVLNRKEF